MYCRCLSLILARWPDFQVVGEANSASEAIEKTAELNPHVVLIDLHLPDGYSPSVNSIICRQPWEGFGLVGSVLIWS